MHRSKNFWAAGNQEYFKEKRPVNARVGGTAHLAEIFPRPKDADEYQPSPSFCPSGRQFGSYDPLVLTSKPLGGVTVPEYPEHPQ
jgi:hypothetical protein